MTLGLPIDNSNPSLRIVSINTDRWRRPRPETENCSVLGICSARKATLRSSSLSSRSRRCRVVKNVPERPASGDVLMPKINWVEPLKTEIAHFVDCIQNGTECLTGPEHAEKVVEILSRS